MHGEDLPVRDDRPCEVDSARLAQVQAKYERRAGDCPHPKVRLGLDEYHAERALPRTAYLECVRRRPAS
eukprot:CAMPEP_0181211994 /NCGR_PEP_ID=MMETSP1096-20121128/24100_1 /TAXON_ID=156174 ORGANISM="Chrysochromulina ericina, Strain CCMP281" /NCGR_SAMPLE_ID=MMETSP1096 /ASSEMBLY_ACC=CAM_ASM_000453 /LENGTH=68 /DNA_ID=CAMNT_0023303467 /DNA_START=609 /DNA_END=811 /DNA_ORIENTATION=-